jgi:REP element-mobilizing transposase RayT
MSYTNLLYHIVYATKGRAPLISLNLKDRLYSYLGGIVRQLDCVLIEINGMPEHVHLLVKIRPTISVSDFLCKLKSNSSGWARKQRVGLRLASRVCRIHCQRIASRTSKAIHS